MRQIGHPIHGRAISHAQPTHGEFSLASNIRAIITGLTANPTHGQTAQIGVELTGNISGLEGGETVVHSWTADGVEVGTAQKFTPTAGLDLQLLRYAPTVDGEGVASPAATIRYAPPTIGTVVPVDEVQAAGGTVDVNVAAFFNGADLDYSIASVPWASLTGDTATIDRDDPLDTTLAVTATNSGGSASVNLSVTITAAPVVGTITPIVAPTTQQTYETQFVDELTGYETIIDPANYTTDGGGTINVPEIQTQDDGLGAWVTQDEEYPFQLDQVVRIRVTDTGGSEYLMTLSTVEYFSQSEVSATGFGQIDVNSIVPDNRAVPITFDGVVSDSANFTSLAVAPKTLREATFAGTQDVGQTLTLTPPITAYDPALGSISEVWTTTAANSVSVTDPHAPTLLIDAADIGTFDITCTTTQGANSIASTVQFTVSADAAWTTPVWDDATDTFTANYVNGTRYDWALYNNADGQPTVSDGVWTGTVATSGGGLTSDSAINITPTYDAGVSADRVIFVVSNATSQDTETYTFTENVASQTLGQQLAGILFASGEAGFVLDTTVATGLTQTDGGAAVADGDPVGYLVDSSGNGNDGAQATALERPTWDETTGTLSFSDHQIDIVGADPYTATSTIFLVVQKVGTGTATPINDSDSNGRLHIQNNNSNPALSDGWETVTSEIYLSGTALSGITRNDVYDALDGAALGILEMRNVDLTAAQDLIIGQRHTGAIPWDGLIGTPCVTTNNTPADLDAARAAYATAYGITLP